MANTSIQRIDIGDAQLHVEITGPGSGPSSGSAPDLLLVAGLGGRGAFWKPQIDALCGQFRCITFDHRGCGNSTPGLLAEDTAHMARDAAALLDALGIERTLYIGHSTGGAIGQHLALDHPERLEKLVLSCSWPGPDAYFLELFRLRRAILERAGPQAYLSSGTFLGFPSRYLQPQIASARATMEERLRAFPGMEVELSRIAAVMSHDLRARLPEIAVPTLCIGAEDDQITPSGFTEEMAAAIPGAQLHLLPRGGHFCPTAQTQAYNARIIRFLTS